MKAELTFSHELSEQIADRVIERLKPLLSDNGKKETDIIFDVKGLSEYLKVSKKWIYERTHFKEIPYLKVGGQLRFKKSNIDKWLHTYSVPVASTPSKGTMRVVK